MTLICLALRIMRRVRRGERVWLWWSSTKGWEVL